MGVNFDDRESLRSTSDMRWSNLDIDAIIRTFTREQQPQAPIQSLPPGFDTGEFGVFNNGSAFPLSDMAANNNLLNEQTMLLTAEDMSSLYDPIFGFNGSTFDDFDMEFGSNSMWDG